jgi:hypothetical protein
MSNPHGTRFVLNKLDTHFNDWHPGATPMIDLGHGRWVKELTLPPGRYEYQFVVDGHWMHDRTAHETVYNPFGGLNSVVEVPETTEFATNSRRKCHFRPPRVVNCWPCAQ